MIKLGDWQAPCSLGIVPNSVMDVFQGEKVDGVLGMNFIKNYAVSFCSQKKQVQFFASSNTTINRQNTYDLSGLGFNAAKAVQMIKGEDNLYSIEAILNGTIKCGFIIDSGAYMSQLSKRCAMQLGLPLDGVTRQQSFLFGEVFLLNGKLKEILVGQTKIAEVIVDYPKTDPSDSLPPLLGMDIFNRYRMFWDFPNSLMYMEKYSKK
ncbi:MAG: retropepsin-like aspartic protease [Flavobacteriales bacterium]|nr:retropepsin-like aspartic protease [Flavobacteriales bacterium]